MEDNKGQIDLLRFSFVIPFIKLIPPEQPLNQLRLTQKISDIFPDVAKWEKLAAVEIRKLLIFLSHPNST